MITLPKNEIIWLKYIQHGKTTHIITSTSLKDMYYLYEVKGEKLTKTRYKAHSPIDLYKHFENGDDSYDTSSKS